MTSKPSDIQIRNEQSLMTLDIKNTNVVNDVLPLKEEGEKKKKGKLFAPVFAVSF